MIYHAFSHSAMSYRIIFWGNSLHSSTIFIMQKKAIRIMERCGNRVSCRNLFKKLQILPLTLHYLLSFLMFVVTPDKEIIYTCLKQTSLFIKNELIIQG